MLYVGGPEYLWSSVEYANAMQALELFLASYAFERAGANPDYAPAAAAALRRVDSGLDPRSLWTTFGKIVGPKTNPNVNPLNHERSKSCCCALCVLCNGDGPTNLIISTRDMLRNDQVALAHDTLTKIRGIGNKIASIFLRDVALRYEIEPAVDRELLQ